jgi:hypothetical protein
MSRKSALINESDQVLGQSRKGSHTTRLWRKYVMRKIINELVLLKAAPPSLKNLNDTHYEMLIQYWRSQELSEVTISKNFSVLRFFYRCAPYGVQMPTNQQLGISTSRKTYSKPEIFPDLMDRLKHPISQTILAFQLYFGLTKVESVRINLELSEQERALFIPRGVAHNGKDREIPILSEHQRRIIQDRKAVLGKQTGLVQCCSEADLHGLFKAEMIIAGQSHNALFRAHYARVRFNDLLQSEPPPASRQKLMKELGLASKYQLERMLL